MSKSTKLIKEFHSLVIAASKLGKQINEEFPEVDLHQETVNHMQSQAIDPETLYMSVTKH